jgi:hypothetical protein
MPIVDIRTSKSKRGTEVGGEGVVDLCIDMRLKISMESIVIYTLIFTSFIDSFSNFFVQVIELW